MGSPKNFQEGAAATCPMKAFLATQILWVLDVSWLHVQSCGNAAGSRLKTVMTAPRGICTLRFRPHGQINGHAGLNWYFLAYMLPFPSQSKLRPHNLSTKSIPFPLILVVLSGVNLRPA